MKKIILSLSLIITIIVTLCSCGNTSDTTSDKLTTTSSCVTVSGKASSISTTTILKFALPYAADHPITTRIQKMADTIKKDTKGKLEVVLYPGEQLGSTNDILDMIAVDSADMTIQGSGALATRNSRIKIYDAPYVFRDYKHMLAFSKSDIGQAIWEDLANESNIRVIGTMYNGLRYVTSNKEIKTPTDMKGLKLRVPDEPMALAYGEAMGANPTPMTFSEVYLALQNGTVDAQENPLVNIISAKFYEVQKYLILTGHIVSNQTVSISDKKYKALSDDVRKVLDEELTKAMSDLSEQTASSEEDNINFLKEQGMTVVEPDVDAFKTATSSVITDYQDEWGTNLYDDIQKIQTN